jgi:TnpA family transposase
VFFYRLGELRDRTHENQRHRACGLNLMVSSIVLWNTAKGSVLDIVSSPPSFLRRYTRWFR